MISGFAWRLQQLSRRLWFRATLISLLAVTAALVSLLISPILPWGLSAKIGADSVDRILNIIASSMLAVTTFSLSTMVAAYGAATSNVTPRATKLLIEDSTTQNVLAVFIGSFLYSLVAIITLSMGAYGERGRVVLFGVTLVVVLLIVGTMLRWINYLIWLGRVGETTEQVEKVTASAMRSRREQPNLGGRPLLDPQAQVPKDAIAICDERVGYLQHVDVGAVERWAKERETLVYLNCIPGTFLEPSRPVAWCDMVPSNEDATAFLNAFTIKDERNFGQDPRFGLSVMAEIASRALSPGLNDPGTAIDVISRAVRTLLIWADAPEDVEPSFSSVYVPSVTIEELFDDIFSPIARDGAAIVEVQIRLQKAYAALSRTGNDRFLANARHYSALALQRAEDAMTFEPDLVRVRQAAGMVG